MVEWKTVALPFPESDVTHCVMYRQVSALEVEAFNLPLTTSDNETISLIKDVFSLFGHIDEVTLHGKKAVIKFESENGLNRAVTQKRKHQRVVPSAFRGEFGIDSFIAKYNEVHPDLDTLERVSNEFIEQFEKKEQESRDLAGGRHVVRMTEAEMHELMQKHQKKMMNMQSGDFYAFQQKDRPNLATELLSTEGPAPRHMKKKPKTKKPNLAFTPKKADRQ